MRNLNKIGSPAQQNIGSAKARQLGFVAEDGERFELEKVIDEKNQQLIIRLKPKDQP